MLTEKQVQVLAKWYKDMPAARSQFYDDQTIEWFEAQRNMAEEHDDFDMAEVWEAHIAFKKWLED